MPITQSQLDTIINRAQDKLPTLKVNESLSGSEDWTTWKVQIEDWLDVNDIGEWIDANSALSDCPHIQTRAVTVEPRKVL